MSADGGVFFHQINLFTGVGQFQRGLNARDAAADNHDIGINVNNTGCQGRQ